jgi:hypothetical protein
VAAWFVRDGKQRAQQYQHILRLLALNLQFINILHTCTQNTRWRGLLLDMLCRRAWSSNDSTDFSSRFFRGGCHLENGMKVSDGEILGRSYSIQRPKGYGRQVQLTGKEKLIPAARDDGILRVRKSLKVSSRFFWARLGLCERSPDQRQTRPQRNFLFHTSRLPPPLISMDPVALSYNYVCPHRSSLWSSTVLFLLPSRKRPSLLSLIACSSSIKIKHAWFVKLD